MNAPSTFLALLRAHLERIGLPVADLQPDHLCYRTDTMERYRSLRDGLFAQNTLLGEHFIGGRPIATFRMAVGHPFGGHVIDVVELAAPKPDRPYAEGWEHAEFVVPEDLRCFVRRHDHLPWDLGSADKAHGGEVRLSFGTISVKFRRMPLAKAIALESRG